MSEAVLQSSALKKLNALPNCIAENVSGNAAQSGRADINGCYRGQAFKIELKILDEENTPTEKQLAYLKRWVNKGAAVCVAYTLDDVMRFVANMPMKAGWARKYTEKCTAFACYRKGGAQYDKLQSKQQLQI